MVEVASPSTRKIDASLKLTGYFSLPSVQHYLIVDPDGPPVIHHRRQGDGTILTIDCPRRRADAGSAGHRGGRGGDICGQRKPRWPERYANSLTQSASSCQGVMLQ